MEATIFNDSQKSGRACLNCGLLITSGNSKRVYCKDSCRVSHHRKAQTQTIRFQGQKMKEQKTTIDKLSDAPTQRKEAVRVVNPEWQLANQVYAIQKELCDSLNNQLSSLKVEIHHRKSGNRGAYYGSAMAIALVLCLVANRYDEHKKSLNLSFVITSLSLLIGMGIMGYWVGKGIHTQLIAYNEGDDVEWTNIEQKRGELEGVLLAEQHELGKLQKELSRLNQFSSEMITTVENMRIVPHE